MASSSAARRYAKAIFGIAQDPSAARRAALGAVCEKLEVGRTVRNFCALLVDQRRVIDFPGIRSAFDDLADAASGRTRARVVSANPLGDDQRQRLQAALAARTGQQVELEESVDPDLLGGAIATVGGLVFDGSLRTQLQQLRSSLTKQA